jgi:hypothetical protein
MGVKGLSFSAIGGRQKSRQATKRVADIRPPFGGLCGDKGLWAKRPKGFWTTLFKVRATAPPKTASAYVLGRFRGGLGAKHREQLRAASLECGQRTTKRKTGLHPCFRCLTQPLAAVAATGTGRPSPARAAAPREQPAARQAEPHHTGECGVVWR